MDILTGTTLQHMVEDNKRLFQELLPEIIKRLILHSCSGVSQIRIPGKDDVWAPGFDGIVQSSDSTKYVCCGTSVWEFGTNSNSLSKINTDYNKRTTNPLSIDKTKTEFYLVIPFIWAYDNQGESIPQWENEHKENWKNVHIFDATILADWINAEPAVCAWLLEQVGREREIDFSSVSSAWKSFSSKTNPALSKTLFLNSREIEIDGFWSSIEKQQIIRVKADSTIDSYGFCLSAILEKEELSNLIIVVNNQSTYKELCNYCKNKIFLLNFKLDCDVIPGNQVILCFNKEDRTVHVDIELLQLTKLFFEKALKDMRLPDDDIYSLYGKTHGNLLSLIRKIPGSVSGNAPKWANLDRIELLTPLLFLGNFDTTNEYDRNMVAFLANESYEKVIDKYNSWLSLEDAPVKRVDSYFVLIDFEEAWEVLNVSTTSSFYERLLLAIEAIVVIDNNIASANEGELKIADSRSKRYFHNLALDLVYFSNTDETDIVCESVQRLIDKYPSSGLIFEHFALLAEAAPYVVMSFLESQEKQPDGIVEQCFLPGGDNLDYCKLLFALDELILHEETRVRACDFLFRICVKTQSMEFTLSNSPRESLLVALCLWNEYTLFTIKEKEGLIKKYLSSDEVFAAGFVTDLILKESAVFGVREGTKHIPKMPILRKELVDTTNEIAKELFRCIIKNHRVVEIKKLLKGYERFYNETLLQTADLFIAKEYHLDQIIPLNYELRRCAYRASKDESRIYWTSGLNKWIDVTTPIDPICQEGWIFYEYDSYFSFEEDETGSSMDQRTAKNNELRKETLAKLVQMNKPSEVAILAQCSKDDYRMGFFYGQNLNSEYLYAFAKESYRLKKNRLLCGLVESASKTDCISVLNSLKPDDQLIILSSVTRCDIIDWINTPEKERAFWAHQMMREFNDTVYNKLLIYNPFNLLSYYAYLKEQPLLINIDRIKEVIRVILATSDSSAPNNRDSYALNEIIASLNKEGYETTEWAELCAELYDNGWIQQYPSILKGYYFSHPDVLCDKVLAMSGNAYSQFNFYYELPDRAYTDSYAFTFFVDTFFVKHTENDLLISVLGSILGKSREGTDKIFPHENIRIALEKYKATNLWRDVLIGKINSRGGRTICDGSNEKRISEEYKRYAQQVEIDFPETARLLRELSKNYAFEGKQDRLFSEIGTSAWW